MISQTIQIELGANYKCPLALALDTFVDKVFMFLRKSQSSPDLVISFHLHHLLPLAFQKLTFEILIISSWTFLLILRPPLTANSDGVS